MITASPNAKEGSVSRLLSYSPADFPAPCVILCRNTAPLISFAFSLLRRRVPCSVRGKDIGARLASLIKRQRASDLPDLVVRLGQWRADQLAFAKDPTPVEDMYQSLMWVISEVGLEESVETLCKKISSLFSDDSNASGVLLSTIHKAKGLEWTLVFLLDKDRFYPNRRATLAWQKIQEKNLIYVALTRSSDQLVYISSDNWKKEN